MKVLVISGLILAVFMGILNFTVKQAEKLGAKFEKSYTQNLLENLK